MKKVLLVCLFLTSCGGNVIVYPPVPASKSEPGGSSYIFTSMTDQSCHGVIRNYGNNPSIKQNLYQIYASGQRRLSIQQTWLHELQVCSGDPTAIGFNFSSDLTNVDQQYIDNFKQYITDAKAIGFQEFDVILGPLWNNNAQDAWPTFEWGSNNPNGIDYYAENIATIKLFRNLLVSLGVPYRIILQDEPFHESIDEAVEEQYVAHIWQDYVSAFGLSDTCGVTIASGTTGDPTHEAIQLNTFLSIVDSAHLGRPNFYCFNEFSDDSGKSYTRFHQALSAKGVSPSVPVIVTSTYYNDARNASLLRQASNSTGRQILYLMQWVMNDPSMTAFNNYKAQGF